MLERRLEVISIAKQRHHSIKQRDLLSHLGPCSEAKGDLRFRRAVSAAAEPGPESSTQ